MQIDVIHEYLTNFTFREQETFSFMEAPQRTSVATLRVGKKRFPRYTNEFWTSKQRRSASLHEISYRACFKAQLPRFFIRLLTRPGDTVYDPFCGRGTTALESALLNRNIVCNDINPLSVILIRPRLNLPDLSEIRKKLDAIRFYPALQADIDLSMFFHPETESELVSLRKYLIEKKAAGQEDAVDEWIRMVATNRLTGHSPGFFSVYTLPPNQAVSPQSQQKINAKRGQKPEYRDVKTLIYKKSKSLFRNVSPEIYARVNRAGRNALLLTCDARNTPEIPDESVHLTVTSPPFLNVVQYSQDNWMRCWFNDLDAENTDKQITMASRIREWESVIADVFRELYRVTRKHGWVVFEVGEVKGGKIRLDEHVIPLGISAGFNCVGVVINQQVFTKTSNIWGISNNSKGTNSNRIVLFVRE